MKYTIRLIQKEDLNDLKKVLQSIELFPAEMLEEMSSDYFENSNSEEIWFTALINDIPIGIGFCAPEKFTDGTFNLYAIGIHASHQGKGIGQEMMAFLEEYLSTNGARILIVDTSGTDAFTLTRTFYEKLGYKKEAVLKDFWAEGDDKVTYTKRLIP
ncbi:GNAT family N-acetyltransferase [Flammeovirga sp. SJP92]|uniref:GNAT family N-acetyltransferase n=1 Tax=Flammeovirga sp. SJP92 TaxID=1775430 RepID=UPI0007886C33|nr:GNAT family N-acetyltransferase [Flammeovirga sp. SJP92]KXX71105.1 hypothetical protein AVL50_09745 [Flammeovirga sp. SJP92]